MRSPLLAVAGLAVDVPVGPVARDDRVQGLGAVAALVALPVPLAALGEHLLGCEDHAATAGTALAGRGLDYRGVDHGGAGGRIAASSKDDIIAMDYRVGGGALSHSVDHRTVQIGKERIILFSRPRTLQLQITEKTRGQAEGEERNRESTVSIFRFSPGISTVRSIR